MLPAASGSVDSSILEERRLGDEEPIFRPDDIESESSRLLNQSCLLVEIKQLADKPSALGRHYDQLREKVAHGPLAEHVASYHLDQAPFIAILEHETEKKQKQQQQPQEEEILIHKKHFLFVAGGHGRLRAPFAFERELPSYWKTRIVDPLRDLGVRFNVIVLDSCYSASWISEFRSLLVPDSGAILLAHGSCSIAGVSANLLEVFGQHGETLTVPLEPAEIEALLSPALEEALVSSLPRDYFTDFFASKVVVARDDDDRERMFRVFDDFAERYRAHCESAEQQQQQEGEDDDESGGITAVVSKLFRLHAALLHSEFDSPPTSSPLYVKSEAPKPEPTFEQAVAAAEGAEEQHKEKSEKNELTMQESPAAVAAVLPPAPPPAVYDYDAEWTSLIKRITSVATFFDTEFRAVLHDTKLLRGKKDEEVIAQLIDKLSKVTAAVTRGLCEQFSEEHGVVEEEKHLLEQKQKRFLLDHHWEVQKVVNTALDLIWNSELRPPQEESNSGGGENAVESPTTATTTTTTTFRSVLRTLERTFPMTSMTCLDASGTLYREDAVLDAGRLVSFGTAVDGASRSMLYDHEKCEERGGVEKVEVVDSREYAKKLVDLFRKAF